MLSHNHSRNSFGLAAALLAAAWGMGIVGAQAQDSARYPDWKGEWVRIGAGGQYDPTKFGEVGDIWLSSSELYEEQRKAGKAPRLAPEKVERLKFVIGGQ